MANDVSTSFFTEYTLNKPQSQAVEAAVAAAETARNATQALYDALIASGLDGSTLSPEDVAAILAAKDAAVNAKNQAATSAATVETAKTATLSAASAAQGYRDDARAAAASVGDIQEAVDAGVATIQAAASDVEEVAGQAIQAKDDAVAASASAVVASDLASRMANEVAGVEVLPGKYSGYHYLEACRAAATVAASFRKKVLGNQPGNVYTITAADFFSTIEMNVTNATTVKLPVNLWQTVEPDGAPTEAWARFRRHKDSTAIVTFEADSTSTILDPVILAQQVFVYASEPATTDPVGTHTISVPAGSNRRIAFLLHVTHNNVKDPRNTTLAATNTTGLTKAAGDSSTGNYAGTTPVDACLWEASVSGSSTVDVTITLTNDGTVLAYVLYVLVASNTSAFQASPVNSTVTTADTQHELTLTPSDAKSVSIFLISHRGHDALPLTAGLSGGTLFASGKTPRSRNTKDLSYIAGYKISATAVASTFTSTSAKSERGAVTGVIMRPNSSTVSAVLTTPDGATLSSAGKACTIFAHSDGANYTKEG